MSGKHQVPTFQPGLRISGAAGTMIGIGEIGTGTGTGTGSMSESDAGGLDGADGSVMIGSGRGQSRHRNVDSFDPTRSFGSVKACYRSFEGSLVKCVTFLLTDFFSSP